MKLVKRLMLIMVIVVVPMVVYGQVGFDSTDVTDAPIDGGVSVLLIAGIGYGARKLRQRRAAQAGKAPNDQPLK